MSSKLVNTICRIGGKIANLFGVQTVKSNKPSSSNNNKTGKNSSISFRNDKNRYVDTFTSSAKTNTVKNNQENTNKNSKIKTVVSSVIGFFEKVGKAVVSAINPDSNKTTKSNSTTVVNKDKNIDKKELAKKEAIRKTNTKIIVETLFNENNTNSSDAVQGVSNGMQAADTNAGKTNVDNKTEAGTNENKTAAEDENGIVITWEQIKAKYESEGIEYDDNDECSYVITKNEENGEYTVKKINKDGSSIVAEMSINKNEDKEGNLGAKCTFRTYDASGKQHEMQFNATIGSDQEIVLTSASDVTLPDGDNSNEGSDGEGDNSKGLDDKYEELDDTEPKETDNDLKETNNDSKETYTKPTNQGSTNQGSTNQDSTNQGSTSNNAGSNNAGSNNAGSSTETKPTNSDRDASNNNSNTTYDNSSKERNSMSQGTNIFQNDLFEEQKNYKKNHITGAAADITDNAEVDQEQSGEEAGAVVAINANNEEAGASLAFDANSEEAGAVVAINAKNEEAGASLAFDVNNEDAGAVVAINANGEELGANLAFAGAQNPENLSIAANNAGVHFGQQRIMNSQAPIAQNSGWNLENLAKGAQSSWLAAYAEVIDNPDGHTAPSKVANSNVTSPITFLSITGGVNKQDANNVAVAFSSIAESTKGLNQDQDNTQIANSEDSQCVLASSFAGDTGSNGGSSQGGSSQGGSSQGGSSSTAA